MINLTEENVQKYLETILPKIPALQGTRVLRSVTVTEQTYVNYIFRVTLKRMILSKDHPSQTKIRNRTENIYLRQTRDHVKTKPDKKLSPRRIWFEVKILKLLKKIKTGVVPEVLYLDRTNNVALLSDIKRGAPLLVSELVEGRSHPETGTYFGKILAAFHRQTIGISHRRIHGSEAKNQKAVDFHLGMRLEPAQSLFPKETEKLLTDSQRSIRCLVLGDLASKNIFVDKRKIRFLDLERAFVGDPAFDLAFLFCHYLIEIEPKHLSQSLRFIKSFMKTYCHGLATKLSIEELNRLENRIIRFLGLTILYRLFGFYLVINLRRNRNWWQKVAQRLIGDKISTDLCQTLTKIIQPKNQST